MPGQPGAFMSYVRFDDRHDDGRLSQLRERLSAEVQVQSGEEFPIFQDRHDISWGENWEQRINQELDAATFLLVILTPSFFRSQACRTELERFLVRERELGRNDLILPLYYISAPMLENSDLRKRDKLAEVLVSRQFEDWRELRLEPFTSPMIHKAIARLAQKISDRLQRSWSQSAIPDDLARDYPGASNKYAAQFQGRPVKSAGYRLGFDQASVGFFKIVDWNTSRRLDEYYNVGAVEHVRGINTQNWIPEADLKAYLDEEYGTPGAPCPSLVGYVEDTRELSNEKLILRVIESQDYQRVAISRYLRDHADVYAGIVDRVESSGVRAVLAKSPRSNICINVTVMSREGTILSIRRSPGVRTWPGYYQLGAREVMISPMPGEGYETCFDLARRALVAGLGLYDRSEYYGQIVFSWFGYYLPEASANFFAHVRSRLTEVELSERCARSETAFEIGSLEWIPFTTNFVRDVVGQWSNGPWSPRQTDGGLRFLPHACLSVTQLDRIMSQGMLPDPTTR